MRINSTSALANPLSVSAGFADVRRAQRCRRDANVPFCGSVTNREVGSADQSGNRRRWLAHPMVISIGAIVMLYAVAHAPSVHADTLSAPDVLRISGGGYDKSFVNDDQEQRFVGSGTDFDLDLFWISLAPQFPRARFRSPSTRR